eukprot:scaffold14210_cov122-Skeletonema_dohrnii-CCMP3373.AAC.2
MRETRYYQHSTLQAPVGLVEMTQHTQNGGQQTSTKTDCQTRPLNNRHRDITWNTPRPNKDKDPSSSYLLPSGSGSRGANRMPNLPSPSEKVEELKPVSFLELE